MKSVLAWAACAALLAGCQSARTAAAVATAKDRVAAVDQINVLEPPSVYERLRLNLPYEEARHYLAKVVQSRRHLLSFGSTTAGRSGNAAR